MPRALVCSELGDEDRLRVVDDWPGQACGDGQVRIAMHTTSVNFPDTLIIRGLYQMKPELPFVPGSEGAGVITEVGGGVEGLTVGDRVLTLMGNGAFTTEVVASTPPWQVLRIPDAMSWEDAAAFNMTYGTAYHALHRRGSTRPGEVVLVTGAAGGCGLAAVQIAKAMGARVIAVAGGDEKTALAAANGADATIDHRTTPSITERVREVTDGHGADVVFDTVGGADVRDLLRAMAWNGRFLVVGFAGGEIPTIRTNQTILKSISVVGIAYGMSAILDPVANREDFDQLFAWYVEGAVRPHIGHRFPFDRAADAIRVVSERRALGKVVVEMTEHP
jgi:NADPH2:quinone reductase